MKSLRVWTGPVHSEKTTKALHHARRLLRRGFDLPFVIRPTRSVREHEAEHPGFLISKSGLKYPSLELDTADEICDAARDWGAVWIDEPMLWIDEPLVYDAVIALRRIMPVLISGCSATSEMQPFGESIPRLIAIADRVEFCRADCDECGTLGTATRSRCLNRKDGQVLVGGEESYQAVCPKCWTRSGKRHNVTPRSA